MSDKLLKNIVKKNYNNRLEAVLSNKEFEEDVKNTLLSLFYKIENGYNDYKTVKCNSFNKKEYIEKLINIIDKDCESIRFINKNTKQAEFVNASKGEIVCYPIEINILYALSKIQKRTIEVQFLDEVIDEAFSYLLNVGNNINIVEPLRDFNGFSWNIEIKDIENLNYNLLYQNLIFLAGNNFIDKWANNLEPMTNYFDLFKDKLQKKYGNEIAENIIFLLIQITLELKALNDNEFNKKLVKKINNLKQEKQLLQNKQHFLTKVSSNKKTLEKRIKEIDKIINNNGLLLKEYEKRNEKLELKEKIFSTRVLKKILQEERKNYLIKINEYNKIMNPNMFLEKKKTLEIKINYIDVSPDLTNLEESVKNKILELQKIIIRCMYINICHAKEKKDIIQAIYEYRYYNLIPVNFKNNIAEIEDLDKYIEKLTETLIKKASEMKVLTKISEDEQSNYYITKKLFLSKIISIEDISIKLNQQNEKFYLIVYDEEVEDNNLTLENIDKQKLNIKNGKKVKLII